MRRGLDREKAVNISARALTCPKVQAAFLAAVADFIGTLRLAA
jgi:hypothetical protein